MVVQTVNIEPLQKAFGKLKKFRETVETEQEKAGAVHAFDYCFELSWKLVKRVLASRGQEAGSPKDTFRKAALEKLIDDPEVWFGFLERRRLTPYTYRPENLESIVAILDEFLLHLNKLIQNISLVVQE